MAQLERHFGITLPTEVREMLAEFNGVWQKNPEYPANTPPDRLYLTVKDMLVDVPNYLRENNSGEFAPNVTSLMDFVRHGCKFN